MNIIYTENKAQLDRLYNDSAMTFEGLNLDEQNLNALKEFVADCGAGLKPDAPVYVTTGKVMNSSYSITGTNAYPDDLNIVSIMLADMENALAVAIPMRMYGGRWFDDIVDNNARREEAKA